MILATVGSEQYAFNRLMTWLDAIIRRGFLAPDDLMIHFGDSTYIPPGVECYQSMNQNRFQELLERSHLVISDCTAQALIRLDRSNKPYILVPRSQTYKEYVDDEQVALAAVLTQFGVPIAWSPGDIVRFVTTPHRISLSTIAAADRTLYQHLKANAKKSPAPKLNQSSPAPEG